VWQKTNLLGKGLDQNNKPFGKRFRPKKQTFLEKSIFVKI
jgi:hypothetical protein